MPRFTTSANCTGTLSAAQKTPETARPRSETQPEWGKRGRPPPAMRGPEAATPRVTRYSATASLNGSFEAYPDFAGWHAIGQTDFSYTSYGFNSYVDRSGYYATDGSSAAVLSFSGSIYPGGTGKGPAIVSDPFAVQAGSTISFRYNLYGDSDAGRLVAKLIDASTGQDAQILFSDNSQYTYSQTTSGSP